MNQYENQQQYSQYQYCDQYQPLPSIGMPSNYSSGYYNIQEVLYYEPGDGEIFVFYDHVHNI